MEFFICASVLLIWTKFHTSYKWKMREFFQITWIIPKLVRILRHWSTKLHQSTRIWKIYQVFLANTITSPQGVQTLSNANQVLIQIIHILMNYFPCVLCFFSEKKKQWIESYVSLSENKIDKKDFFNRSLR